MKDDLPFEDSPPITEPALEGEPDHTQADDDSQAQPSWSNIEDEDDRDLGGQEPPHPANPALVSQAEPETVMVTMTPFERLNMSIKMTEMMDELKAKGEEVLRINRIRRNLVKEIDTYQICVRTGMREVPADQPRQLDLLDSPPSPAQAQAQFAEMGAHAAALAEEPVPLELSEDAKADRARIDGLNAQAEAQQAANGVKGSDEFQETSTDELSRQAGRRKRDRKVA